MALSFAFLSLLVALAVANPLLDARQARQRYVCGRNAIEAKQCIDQGGPAFVSAFCSSYLPITTVIEQSTLTLPGLSTSTSTVTDATAIATADATTTTETSVETTGITRTTTNATSFDATTTTTSFTSTTITTELLTETIYTCPTSTTTEVEELETAPARFNRFVPFPTPSCLSTLLDQRVNAVSRGCRCEFLSTPTSTQTVLATPTTTITTTVAGSTITPVITSVVETTDIETSVQPATLTTTSTTTELAVFTSTVTETTTVTSPSPIPSAFNLALLPAGTIVQPNATNSTTPPFANGTTPIANATLPLTAYARLAQPAGASAPLLAFASSNTTNATATVFGLSPQGALIIPAFTSNTTNGSTSYVVAARSLPDFLPFLYLQIDEEVGVAQVPVCSTCDGVLDCQYPGTVGSVFAVCFAGQYLALGPESSFGDVDGGCEVVSLGVAPVVTASGLGFRNRGARWS